MSLDRGNRTGTDEYRIDDFSRKPTFASFLPGIAGMKGIPLWSFYVNRGQGIVSFGVENKDHPIMEFYPAHTAYRNVSTTGFRTFLRKDGVFFEPFAGNKPGRSMTIEMNGLRLEDCDLRQGIRTEVSYFILPEEKLGALVRLVTLTNIGESACELEAVDGMPAIVPYGINDWNLKNMTQTAKAWMQYEKVREEDDGQLRVPFYRVRASMEDSASVSEVKGGCFGLAVDEKSSLLGVIADPTALFAYDNSLQLPYVFAEAGLQGVAEQAVVTSNLVPCCFFAAGRKLAAGESMHIYEMIGQVDRQEILQGFVRELLTGEKAAEWFLTKQRRAAELAQELCSVIDTKTGDATFDAYCRYTFMDNALRGGFPIELPGGKIFWVYSRKHGDLERDYNYYSMLPEFYSQGNGNFRDVNQNRRCDTFFAPYVGSTNIHTFYSLLQPDGYNPLGVEKLTYQIPETKAREILAQTGDAEAAKILKCVKLSYTPGQLYSCLNELKDVDADTLFMALIGASSGLVNGDFKEGYWTDHWDYNLDLVEEYLALYPDRERELLFTQDMTSYLSQAAVLPRAKRYVETEKGIRQYHFLDEKSLRNTGEKLVRKQYGRGEILYMSLLEKLILLSAIKYATLDSYGMGIEMEGGKPGWYDALNGAPGLLGSSVCESYELARMMDFTIGMLKKYPFEFAMLTEVGELIEALTQTDTLLLTEKTEHGLFELGEEELAVWNRRNDLREAYRARCFDGMSGEYRTYETSKLAAYLEGFRANLQRGIDRARAMGDGMSPAYFTYEVTSYYKDEEGIHPTGFAVQQVPFFLEGAVRYLKLDIGTEQKRRLYELVRDSALYDRKLSMYKVNAPLAGASYELGRARAFTPGWLENESIWLHMEYKYLLEILRSGLYPEFAEDFHKALIPFRDPKVYGRSVLENSSFIVSSANPDPTIHGRGFVARLSGSTIEFLSMWKLMMFGEKPFTLREDGELEAVFLPVIPAYLIGEDLTVSATFMGHTKVNYHLAEKRDYFPGSYTITGGLFRGEAALALREGQMAEVDVYLK